MKPLAEFMERLPEGLDAALILSPENRRYLTGFASSAGTVICTREASYFLIDFRYYEKAKREVSGCEVLLLQDYRGQIEEIFNRHQAVVVGVENASMTLEEYDSFVKGFPKRSFDSSDRVSELLSLMRSIKSPEEVKTIKAAQAITDEAFSRVLEFIAPGKTEKQVAAYLEYQMKLLGADGLAFDTIAVGGENSSLPHGTPTDRPLQQGDFLTMDFGASVAGYCSDMTRTVAIGPVDDLHKTVYQTVLGAQDKAFCEIRPGVPGKQVDAAARKFIDDKGFAGCFGHGLGHSVGLYIHETPCFNTRDETLLEPGMVITVEPGIYLEGRFGVRIEDMILVTPNGYENLTKSEKQLITL